MLSFVPQFKLKEQQIEAVFLVDCSGSMRGQSMEMAKEALQVFLHSLPINSYFNIIVFGSRYEKMFDESKKYDDDTLSTAKKFAAKIEADMGGTEIYSPLEYILQLPNKTEENASRPRQVFVLTDGGVIFLNN